MQEVLVRVAAIGINPVEAYIRGGMHGRSPASLPYTPGHDAAGVIVACGDAVPPRLRVGDRVFTLSTRSGAYADTCVADEAAVHVIPAPLSFAQAACLGVPAYTAARALHQKLRVEPGKTVLVHGATGGVGVAAMQLARRAGLRVIGTAGTDDGVVAIAPYADVVLRHGTPALATEVRAATEGLGVHYILEMLANVNLATDFQCLRQGGGICIIGSRG
ncbi:NADPH:quinone reductase, partial [archaeon]